MLQSLRESCAKGTPNSGFSFHQDKRGSFGEVDQAELQLLATGKPQALQVMFTRQIIELLE